MNFQAVTETAFVAVLLIAMVSAEWNCGKQEIQCVCGVGESRWIIKVEIKLYPKKGEFQTECVAGLQQDEACSNHSCFFSEKHGNATTNHIAADFPSKFKRHISRNVDANSVNRVSPRHEEMWPKVTAVKPWPKSHGMDGLWPKEIEVKPWSKSLGVHGQHSMLQVFLNKKKETVSPLSDDGSRQLKECVERRVKYAETKISIISFEIGCHITCNPGLALQWENATSVRLICSTFLEDISKLQDCEHYLTCKPGLLDPDMKCMLPKRNFVDCAMPCTVELYGETKTLNYGCVFGKEC